MLNMHLSLWACNATENEVEVIILHFTLKQTFLKTHTVLILKVIERKGRRLRQGMFCNLKHTFLYIPLKAGDCLITCRQLHGPFLTSNLLRKTNLMGEWSGTLFCWWTTHVCVLCWHHRGVQSVCEVISPALHTCRESVWVSAYEPLFVSLDVSGQVRTTSPLSPSCRSASLKWQSGWRAKWQEEGEKKVKD